MIKKLNYWSVLAHAKVTGFFRDLRDDERGISNAVVAVLLILVGVLAVVAIWGSLSGQLEKWWKQVSGATISGPANLDGGGGGGGLS